MQPSIINRARAAAESENISLNEYIHRAIIKKLNREIDKTMSKTQQEDLTAFQTKNDEIKNTKPISLGLRWKILTRDEFTCQYCGATNVKLQVDHIFPRCLGGENDETNLITACRTCNAGKSGDPFEATTSSPIGLKLLKAYGIKINPAWFFMSIPVKEIINGG
jgi:hypothetical protein